ncbi:MAG: preprotein translocase subunit YajC [Candidatus Hydrogenedentes bacterium]|nr:preprotein translocase subunit YajC [Candidatus Hydrogenedentota bacterium]
MVFAQEAEGAATPPPGANPFAGSLWIFGAFIAIMYFLMIRPNQKREKERREMLGSLTKGDTVVTSGGIYGTIVGLREKSVVIRVSDEPNVKMEFSRGAVSQVMSRGNEEKEK